MKKLLLLIICLFMCPIISFAHSFSVTKSDGSVIGDLDQSTLQTNLEFGSTIKITDYTEGMGVGVTRKFNYTSENDIPSERKIIIDINGYEISAIEFNIMISVNNNNILDKPVTIEIIDSQNSGRLKKLRLGHG